jgi:tetratricopeptide (TPR) repeat protein
MCHEGLFKSCSRVSRRLGVGVAALAPIALLVMMLALPAEARERRYDADDALRDLRFGAEMAEGGLWREALFRFERVLRVRPDDPRIWNNIAVAREALGDLEGAREAYERARAAGQGIREIEGNISLFLSSRGEDLSSSRTRSAGDAGSEDDARAAPAEDEAPTLQDDDKESEAP